LVEFWFRVHVILSVCVNANVQNFGSQLDLKEFRDKSASYEKWTLWTCK